MVDGWGVELIVRESTYNSAIPMQTYQVSNGTSVWDDMMDLEWGDTLMIEGIGKLFVRNVSPSTLLERTIVVSTILMLDDGKAVVL